MSAYQRLVDLSTEQLEAFKRGDVRRMQQLFVERAGLIAQLPPVAAEADHALIQQALVADRKLSDAIRDRMLTIRSTAAQVHQRRTSMNGYRQGGPAAARLLNFVL